MILTSPLYASSIYLWFPSVTPTAKVPNAYETKCKSYNKNCPDKENMTEIVPCNVIKTVFSSWFAYVWMKNFDDALDQMSKSASLMQ